MLALSLSSRAGTSLAVRRHAGAPSRSRSAWPGREDRGQCRFWQGHGCGCLVVGERRARSTASDCANVVLKCITPVGPQMRAYRLPGGVETLQGWFSRGRKMIPVLSSLPVATAWAGPPPVHSQWPLLFPARISSMYSTSSLGDCSRAYCLRCAGQGYPRFARRSAALTLLASATLC